MTQSDDPQDGATFNLLFVCTGNTCRSPLAEAQARRELAELGWSGVEVRSAGVAAGDGAAASAGALRVGDRYGLDLTEHASRRLDRDLVAWADLILVMSPTHLLRVLELGGEGRTDLLTAFATDEESGAGAIPDPFGGDDETYEETYRVLDELVARSVRRLETILKGASL